MREVRFHLLTERPGHLEAEADAPALRITASLWEELQHEAREALMHHFGSAHAAYRVRVQWSQSPAGSASRLLRRPPALCF